MQTLRLEPRRWRKLLLLGLLLAHGALWWLIDGRSRPQAHAPTRLSELRLIARASPPPPVERPLPRKQAVPAAITRSMPTTAPAPQAVVETMPPPTNAEAPPPERPALLVSSEATRSAIREAARQPLLAERAASAMGDGAPLRPEEKLGGQIQQAAVGDCLKGEFAGGGMGILSAPFWLLAEARGKCRR